MMAIGICLILLGHLVRFNNHYSQNDFENFLAWLLCIIGVGQCICSLVIWLWRVMP